MILLGKGGEAALQVGSTAQEPARSRWPIGWLWKLKMASSYRIPEESRKAGGIGINSARGIACPWTRPARVGICFHQPFSYSGNRHGRNQLPPNLLLTREKN